MKRLLLAPLILALSSPSFAEIDPKVHKMCLQAKDYQGCVNAQTATSSDIPSLRVIQGKTELTGNECPSTFAYIGGGQCQQTRCSGDSWWTRPFGQKDSHVLAGKGWECPGTETIHLDGPTIKASTNPECPDKEPILGVPSSCITQADIEKAEERKAAKKKKKKPLACRNGTWSPNHPQCKESESAITSPMDMD